MRDFRAPLLPERRAVLDDHEDPGARRFALAHPSPELFAEDQDDGRLTDSRKPTPYEQQADDDLNWLYPGYISTLRTFVCPSTRNFIRETNVYTALYNGQIMTLVSDLDDNARSSEIRPKRRSFALEMVVSEARLNRR